jgi:DNA-directed RNA polymerase specialized sigma24 family protein
VPVDLLQGVGATEAGEAPTIASEQAPFTDFVRTRGDRLLEIAWLVTRDTEDARDAVQDALAGLYRRWGRLPTGDEFDAYVRRTVVNACLGVIRRRPRSAAGRRRLAPTCIARWRDCAYGSRQENDDGRDRVQLP